MELELIGSKGSLNPVSDLDMDEVSFIVILLLEGDHKRKMHGHHPHTKKAILTTGNRNVFGVAYLPSRGGPTSLTFHNQGQINFHNYCIPNSMYRLVR